jgi:hypothetical protein
LIGLKHTPDRATTNILCPQVNSLQTQTILAQISSACQIRHIDAGERRNCATYVQTWPIKTLLMQSVLKVNAPAKMVEVVQLSQTINCACLEHYPIRERGELAVSFASKTKRDHRH